MQLFGFLRRSKSTANLMSTDSSSTSSSPSSSFASSSTTSPRPSLPGSPTTLEPISERPKTARPREAETQPVLRFLRMSRSIANLGRRDPMLSPALSSSTIPPVPNMAPESMLETSQPTLNVPHIVEPDPEPIPEPTQPILEPAIGRPQSIAREPETQSLHGSRRTTIYEAGLNISTSVLESRRNTLYEPGARNTIYFNGNISTSNLSTASTLLEASVAPPPPPPQPTQNQNQNYISYEAFIAHAREVEVQRWNMAREWRNAEERRLAAASGRRNWPHDPWRGGFGPPSSSSGGGAWEWRVGKVNGGLGIDSRRQNNGTGLREWLGRSGLVRW